MVAGGLGGGAAVLLSLLNALLLSRAVTRPLHDLRDAIDQVKAGDYEVQLRAHGARELRDVSEGFMHMAQLVDDQRQRLEALAATDPLTGLANHRHFHEALEAELSRARRDGSSLAVIALDLDHFKEINLPFRTSRPLFLPPPFCAFGGLE
ncbi:MAG: diguanylate cyclase [Solirubrobacterales bacterium]|nr:diguanylate cyclase [Solirubrobacterales bacterium]